MDRRKTYPEGDVDLLRRVASNDGPLRCRGYDRVRAKRMVEAKLLRWVGLDFLAELTPRGRLFLRVANGIAGRADA